MRKGRYFSSPKQYEMRTGKRFTKNCPNAGPQANVRGMRKQYWGFERDVVRSGQYIYLQPEIIRR